MRRLNRPDDPATIRSGLSAGLLALALVLAGCGADVFTSAARGVVDDSARAAAHATRLSHEQGRRWCPQAVNDRGRTLTQQQARRCIERASQAWRREPRRQGLRPDQAGSR
jgi:hypothetical protein